MRATLIGAVAILLWSSLAVLTAASGSVPPFQLAAITFAIGGGIGLVSWLLRGTRPSVLAQPPKVWLLGVGGLFGYHALYFVALTLAPPAEVSLLNYLWPLLIVLLSGLLPGETLTGRHIAGGLLGLAGTVILIAGRPPAELDRRTLIGWMSAVAAALVWSSYSVATAALSRGRGQPGQPKDIPSDVVAGFCLATAALAAVAHLVVEPTVWPATTSQWSYIVAIGVGPVGIAFYVWDHGMKHGDIRLLATLSYAAPLLSTLWLILGGYARPTPAILVSCGLIIVAARIASSKTAGRHTVNSR